MTGEVASMLTNLGARVSALGELGEFHRKLIIETVEFLDQAVADVEVVTEAERILRGDRS